MKQLILNIVVLLLGGFAFGQNVAFDQKWDVTLVSGQRYSSVHLDRLEAIAHSNVMVLVVLEDSKSKRVPVDMIKEIRFHRRKRLPRFCLCGGVPALAGFIVVNLVGRDGGNGWGYFYLMYYAAVFTGIGAGVGLLADLFYWFDKYDLSQMTTEKKVETIQHILAEHKK